MARIRLPHNIDEKLQYPQIGDNMFRYLNFKSKFDVIRRFSHL